MNDRSRLIAAAFVRAVATGLIGVLLGLHLARRGLTVGDVGLVIAAGLAGAAGAALIATLAGDRIGRRRLLTILALACAAGGAALAFAESLLVLLGIAFLGMVNGQGRDRGASLVLEQAALPATVSDADRTRTFAWYNVMQDVGHGLGGLLALLPELLRSLTGLDVGASLQAAVLLYGALQFFSVLFYQGLSARVESPTETEHVSLAPDSRRTLWRISLLFGLDSLAGGFLGAALLALFFYQRFGVAESTLALLFVGARILNAISHLGAALLAKRIGLVNTMVFTHIPSSLLLATVAFAPSFPVAAILFLLREGLVEMDVPTRQSYVMAMVRPQERVFASGVTHLVRLGGWAAGPAFAGLLMQLVAVGSPLVAGAAMKIIYDLLLWRAFRHIRPPEERGAPRVSAVAPRDTQP
ncbi:MAG TPA: MFS transporter [Thiobacillaceae bacterium]|nr:MFS transporter [Thiobacillaceae bacterium]